MTVGFAGLTISADDFIIDDYEIGAIIYVFGNTASVVSSFLAVVTGTFRFVYYNNLPPNLMDKAIAKGKIMSILCCYIMSIYWFCCWI